MARKQSFRMAVPPLVDIGRQLLIIEQKLRLLQAHGAADTYDARRAAKEAQSAASRLARDFKKIVYVLERMEDAEYEEERRNESQ